MLTRTARRYVHTWITPDYTRFFTRTFSVSTLDRSPFQLTDDFFSRARRRLQFDQPVRFAPWGKALPGFDWYRGCTSDCEPSCQWTSTVGDVRYDWGQAYNCKHGVKTWDAPYASFDAYFSAKMTAWKSSFDGSGLTLENDPRFGIYVKYANAARPRKKSRRLSRSSRPFTRRSGKRVCARGPTPSRRRRARRRRRTTC